MKQIWVQKELITNLPMNADAIDLMKSSEDNSSRGHDYEHVLYNHFIHRELKHKNAYSFVYPDVGNSHPIRHYHTMRSSYASRTPIQMWVVKKNKLLSQERILGKI